jgi:hypothetical protein
MRGFGPKDKAQTLLNPVSLTPQGQCQVFSLQYLVNQTQPLFPAGSQTCEQFCRSLKTNPGAYKSNKRRIFASAIFPHSTSFAISRT